MQSNSSINGIFFDEPLEKLRLLFRQYWVLALEQRETEAKQLWEREVVIEIESVRQYQTNVEDPDIQTLFFEEKRRVQDLTFIAEHIVQKLKGSDALRPVDGSAPVSGLRTRNQAQQENASSDDQRAASTKPAATNAPGELDIASMIDSMLEEQRS